MDQTFLAKRIFPSSSTRSLHTKFLIVDGITVETGSFNYPSAAERSNAENVLILHGYSATAWKYEDRWQMLWQERTGGENAALVVAAAPDGRHLGQRLRLAPVKSGKWVWTAAIWAVTAAGSGIGRR